MIILLVVATGLLLTGLVMPLMTIKKLVFLRNSFSVVSGIYDLWASGKYFLGIIIALFSVVLPLVKIGLLFTFVFRRYKKLPYNHKIITLIHDYGRWAMLDVFVVAVLIVTVKLGAVASVEIHPGLYIFGAAVLLIMFITDRATKMARESIS